ncbi:MAG: hypothetical protein CMF69_03140 [Magnetovibrio sp.]|nr:hypothetical protein [Magnetovibrio sp.]|tara:strand:+ start:2142 stop:3053 length:912 start_codon:yes stop_codon:yes gene_type:complete
MFFIKLKSIFIDWFLLNKLFYIDYYFNNNYNQKTVNKMFYNLLWYNKSMNFWCSFHGLFHLIYNINSTKDIPFDNKYGVYRYYNNNNCRLKTDKTKSNAYLWNYLPLKTKSKSNWTNDIMIKKNIDFLEKKYNIIKNIYDKHICEMKEHPENLTSLSKGAWSRISLYGINDWEEKFNGKIIDDIKSNFRIAYNHGLVFFSKTSPNTKIKAHYGSSNLRIRLHLGIYVPDKYNTIMNVSNDKLYWEEGKVIAFDDSFYHSSENNSSLDRIVLIIDIFNPYLSDDECLFLRNETLKNLGKINYIY